MLNHPYRVVSCRVVSYRIVCLIQVSLLISGVNPQSVRGSRTGVFIGRSGSDAYEAWTAVDDDQITGYEMTGCTGAMLSNRISYFFDFTGLYLCDTTIRPTTTTVTSVFSSAGLVRGLRGFNIFIFLLQLRGSGAFVTLSSVLGSLQKFLKIKDNFQEHDLFVRLFILFLLLSSF